MKAAVVGHVEWMEFLEVERPPRAGEIVHVDSTFSEPAGGGAVAAVQLARLTGDCTLYTAFGDDEIAARSRARLEELGVRVAAATRRGKPTRRGFTYLDDAGERTINVIGERLHAKGSDDLPWDELRETEAVYFCAGDADALRAARAARAMVATARVLGTLVEGAVELDALVGSDDDPKERYAPGQLDPPPRLAVRMPGAVADAYGAGDSFAACLAFALGDGRDVDEALELAARCGAECMTGHGPYERQLRH